MKPGMLAVAFAAMLGAVAAAPALAQTFPSHPVTLIVPFPAGGPTDTLARVVGDRMKNSLGQTVIIETVTGAGATIGVSRAARAAPDGYTILIGNWTSQVGSSAIYPVQYDVLKDFEPIARLPVSLLMIVGKNQLPVSDAKGLIAWLKANPDKASMATVGAGSAAHLCGVNFEQGSGTRFQFVPYRGAAPAMQDLVAGQIDMFCGDASNIYPFVQSGRAKAFAIMNRTRWHNAPNLPTMEEVGVPGASIPFWNGLWAPKGTPADVIAKLNAAVVDTLADPAVRKRLDELGLEIPARDQQTPQALFAYHKAEIEKWWPMIKAANIKPE
jgi:tripartite-type tricarboxylate transporter receptor subunit TctC